MHRLLFSLSLLLGSLVLPGCMFINIPLDLPPTDYQETTLQSGRKGKILMLDIDGVITSGANQTDPLFGASLSTVNQVTEKLVKARKDDKIRAVILRIDSPGGGVTASDVIYRTVKQYKEDTEVPVYASMLSTAASGGYYIAMAADEVYAHPTSITGSIGVIAMFPQLEGLGNKIGVSVETVKSGENKDLGSPFHDMTEKERSILQTTIDDLYDQFIEVVLEGRPNLSRETLLDGEGALADGRIYTAKRAKEAGLIDDVLYLDEVIDKVGKEIGLPEPEVVLYRRTSRDTQDSVYAKSIHPAPHMERTSTKTNIGLLNIDASDLAMPRGPVFHYLWLP